MSRTDEEKVRAIQKLIDHVFKENEEELLEEMHKRAIHLMLYGDVIPYPEEMDVSIKRILESEDD